MRWLRERRPFLPLLALGLLAGCGGNGGESDVPAETGHGAAAGAAGAADAQAAAEAGTYLNVVVPSVVKAGDEASLRLRVITQAGLPDYDFEGAFRVDVRGPVELPENMTFEPAQEGFFEAEGIRFPTPGVQFLRAVVPGDTVQALANSVNVATDPEYHIYWGDLNGHSDLSSGGRAPGVYFWYAKSVALLDFVALTDNDAWEERTLDDETFREILQVAAEEFEEEGRFVAVPAFEWTSSTYGNRLVYFSEMPSALPTVAAGVDTPQKLRDRLPAGSVVAIPHPSGSEGDHPVDPTGVSSEDLVEMYSALGIFESAGSHRASTRETAGAFVADLLAAGIRPGFVAGSDTRLTAPGNPRGVSYGNHRYPGGLTAVLAKDLSRASVLEALRAKRCYATTGPRYLLEFTVDDAQMGSELTVAAGHRAEVYGSLGSTSNWVRVEIVGPEGAVEVLTPEPGNSDVVELTHTTEPLTESTWLYLRGTDELGGMAWSSPVFLLLE